MDFWAWTILALVVAVIFLVISGEFLVTVVLTGVWVGAIWLLVSYGGVVLDGIGPVIAVIAGMVILSVATLAAMASALEDRRSKKS
jgi:hypothetical protein